MKKGIIFLITILLIGGLVTIFLSLKNKEENIYNEQNNLIEGADQDASKVLVVYFSNTKNTERVALQIASEVNANLFAIEPKEEYTEEDLDWRNENSRVSKEYNDENLRNVSLKVTTVDDWDSYDTIFIGYPIWWGIAAWPVSSFVSQNDFQGKIVYPFCTSSSSSLGDSATRLASVAHGGNWQNGIRFSSNVSKEEVKKWLDTLK